MEIVSVYTLSLHWVVHICFGFYVFSLHFLFHFVSILLCLNLGNNEINGTVLWKIETRFYTFTDRDLQCFWPTSTISHPTCNDRAFQHFNPYSTQLPKIEFQRPTIPSSFIHTVHCPFPLSYPDPLLTPYFFLSNHILLSAMDLL